MRGGGMNPTSNVDLGVKQCRWHVQWGVLCENEATHTVKSKRGGTSEMPVCEEHLKPYLKDYECKAIVRELHH